MAQRNRTRQPARTVLAAFAGWNDAGGAATDALEYLAEQWEAEFVAALEPDDYYDFQVMRPRFVTSGTGRELVWPRTRIFSATTPGGTPVLLVDGIEPSMRWLDFIEELLEIFADHHSTMLISIGALLADVPHSRDIPVTATSTAPALRQRFNLERSDYTGPAGIVSVLEHIATTEADLDAMSLWAAVPHYVAAPPSPKAVVAILTKLSELLGEEIDLGEMPKHATEWVDSINELAEEDPDMAEYVQQLEAAKDTVDSPEASGEALAREFQRFLENQDPGGKGPAAKGH